MNYFYTQSLKSILLRFIITVLLCGNCESSLKSLLSTTSVGNCSHLFGKSMQQQCKGLVTRTLLKDFPDKYAVVNTPFAIFAQDPQMLSVFVTMYNSPLMACKSLIIKDANYFECDKQYVFKLIQSKMFCFHYPLCYFARLRDTCQGIKNSAFIAIPNSALHYAGTGSSGTLRLDTMLILIAIILTVEQYGTYLNWN